MIHAAGARNRAPRRSEIEAGIALLPAFVALLPKLRVVVMAGRTAQCAISVLHDCLPGLPLLAMPHPSPTYVATSPTVATRIEAVLSTSARFCATVRLHPRGEPRLSSRKP